jgi:hypothetical protein
VKFRIRIKRLSVLYGWFVGDEVIRCRENPVVVNSATESYTWRCSRYCVFAHEISHPSRYCKRNFEIRECVMTETPIGCS